MLLNQLEGPSREYQILPTPEIKAPSQVRARVPKPRVGPWGGAVFSLRPLPLSQALLPGNPSDRPGARQDGGRQ